MKNAIMEQLIPLAEAHQRSDEYRKGHYAWRGGGACAIGCTVRDAIALGLVPEGTDGGNHAALASVTGVPKWWWYLVDRIFEGIPACDRPAFPPRVIRAAANVDPENWPKVNARFMVRVLERILPLNRAGVEPALVLWRRVFAGENPQNAEWSAATAAAAEESWSASTEESWSAATAAEAAWAASWTATAAEEEVEARAAAWAADAAAEAAWALEQAFSASTADERKAAAWIAMANDLVEAML